MNDDFTFQDLVSNRLSIQSPANMRLQYDLVAEDDTVGEVMAERAARRRAEAKEAVSKRLADFESVLRLDKRADGTTLCFATKGRGSVDLRRGGVDLHWAVVRSDGAWYSTGRTGVHKADDDALLTWLLRQDLNPADVAVFAP